MQINLIAIHNNNLLQFMFIYNFKFSSNIMRKTLLIKMLTDENFICLSSKKSDLAIQYPLGKGNVYLLVVVAEGNVY